MERAHRHLERGDRRLALVALDDAAHRLPELLDRPGWWNLRSWALADEPELALEVNARGLSVAPHDRDLLASRAELLAETGRLPEAERVIRVVLAADPGDHAALAAYARILSRAGAHDVARGVAEAALAVAPEDPAALSARMDVALAAGEADAERFTSALLRTDPASPEGLHALARQRLRRGDRAGARDAAVAAAREVPGDAVATSQARTMRAAAHWSAAPAVWISSRTWRLAVTGFATFTVGRAALGIVGGAVAALAVIAYAEAWPDLLARVRRR